MNIKNLAIILLTSGILSACIFSGNETPYREIVRVPYIFKIKSFTDKRTDDTPEIINSRSAYPFKREQIAQSLIHSMNNSLFANTPAFLDIKLKKYSTIRENNKYFMSLLMDITAQNDTGVTLASGSFGCIAEKKENFEIFNIIKTSITKDEITVKNRYNKTWQKVTKQCMQDIAYEFNSQIGRNN